MTRAGPAWPGGAQIDALSDGSFVARPSYFGPAAASDAHPELFDTDGAAVLPIGCFVFQDHDRRILVDAGLGPVSEDLADGMKLTGGELPDELHRLGLDPAAVTDVVLTHLHADHVGWLFDRSARATFQAATLWFGRPDWLHFVTGEGEMAAHIRAGLQDTPRHQLRALEKDTAITETIAAIMTPGHTPGSLSVRVGDGEQSLWVLGDAITCPVQLSEPAWHSFGDVWPETADHTRRELWRRLSRPGAWGVGSHFPGLEPGHVDTTNGLVWRSRSAGSRWVDASTS